MAILKIIKERRSIRKFQAKPLSQEGIDKLIEALIWAPSAGNLQSRKFYFVFNQEIKEKLVEAAFDQDFISDAPLVIVGCTDEKISLRYGERGKNLYSICDIALSIQNLMLLAHSEGLGSVWVGTFDEKEVAKILNLPLDPIIVRKLPMPDNPEAGIGAISETGEIVWQSKNPPLFYKFLPSLPTTLSPSAKATDEQEGFMGIKKIFKIAKQTILW